MVKYTYGEGFGLVYERLVREKYFDSLIRRFGVKSVLEVPFNGTAGYTGVNSTYFSEMECNVTLANDDYKLLKNAMQLWSAMGLKANFVQLTPKEKLPFDDKTFDLVWNYCEIEKAKKPKALMKEMARVSRNLVLVITQNSVTYGFFPHKIYHHLRGHPWDHGDPKLMSLRNIIRLVNDCRFPIVESGLIDSPPFPDTWEIMLLPFKERREMRRALRELRKERKTPLLVNAVYGFERLLKVLPTSIEAFFAHHFFVLVRV